MTIITHSFIRPLAGLVCPSSSKGPELINVSQLTHLLLLLMVAIVTVVVAAVGRTSTARGAQPDDAVLCALTPVTALRVKHSD